MALAKADELLRLGHEALATAEWERARALFEQAAEKYAARTAVRSRSSSSEVRIS